MYIMKCIADKDYFSYITWMEWVDQTKINFKIIRLSTRIPEVGLSTNRLKDWRSILGQQNIRGFNNELFYVGYTFYS